MTTRQYEQGQVREAEAEREGMCRERFETTDPIPPVRVDPVLAARIRRIETMIRKEEQRCQVPRIAAQLCGRISDE